jgi:hypothetical protein
MEDQLEHLDRSDDGDEVEAHKLIEDEPKQDLEKRKHAESPDDEEDDVEAHKRR